MSINIGGLPAFAIGTQNSQFNAVIERVVAVESAKSQLMQSTGQLANFIQSGGVNNGIVLQQLLQRMEALNTQWLQLTYHQYQITGSPIFAQQIQNDLQARAQFLGQFNIVV